MLLPRRSPAALAATDLAALALFATVGLLSHRGVLSATGYARDLLPVAGAWALVALALGTYRRPSAPRLLATWALGVPLGIAIRAAALDRFFDGKEAAFLGVALAFTGLFVAGARFVVGLVPARHA